MTEVPGTLRRAYPDATSWTSAGPGRWTAVDPRQPRTLHALTDGGQHWAAMWVSDEFLGWAAEQAWPRLESEIEARTASERDTTSYEDLRARVEINGVDMAPYLRSLRHQ